MNVLKKCLLTLLLASSAHVAIAEVVYADVDAGLLAIYPAGAITSLEKADAALAAVAQFSASSEARFIDTQRACYEKFFTQYCLDNAKDDHRVTSKAIKKVDNEANLFIRQLRADDTDRSLTERNANRAQNKPQ